MKFTHLNGHNPNSESAQRRADRKRMLNYGEVKCIKCGASRATLIKVQEDPAEYMCSDCYKNGNSEV